MNEIGALIKETPESLLTPGLPHEENRSLKPGKGHFPEPNCGHPDLDLLVSRTERNKFMLLISHCIYGTLS